MDRLPDLEIVGTCFIVDGIQPFQRKTKQSQLSAKHKDTSENKVCGRKSENLTQGDIQTRDDFFAKESSAVKKAHEILNTVKDNNTREIPSFPQIFEEHAGQQRAFTEASEKKEINVLDPGIFNLFRI